MPRPIVAVVLASLVLLSVNTAHAQKTWTGAVSNLWSVSGNWTAGIAPVDGDQLVFPSGAANTTTVNDLVGLDLVSLTFPSFPSPYSVGGNGLTLSGGLTGAANISVPITLTATQTFQASGSTFNGVIDVNGHTLTFGAGMVTVSGPIAGSGSVILGSDADMMLTGISPFTGTVTLLDRARLDVAGSLAAASAITSNGGTCSPMFAVLCTTLSGAGIVPAVSFSDAEISPGPSPNFQFNALVNAIGILNTGSLSLALGATSHGAARFSLVSPTPGTGHDQINVTGTVTLANPTLVLYTPGPPPAPGQTFVIINNDGTDPVAGTFNGVPEGWETSVGSLRARISYAAGTGNDVAVTFLHTTTTAVSSSKNPVLPGEAFTLTARVTSPGGVPQGSVTFTDGTIVLGSAALNAAGEAVLSTALTSPGSHTITATYAGAGVHASSSATLQQSVLAQISIVGPATIFEGQAAQFTVRLAAASTDTVTVQYATADGTASAGADYTAASGTLTFPPGTTAQTISVNTTPDSVLESPAETFTVSLSNPVNAAIDTATAGATIEDAAFIPTLDDWLLILLAMVLAVAAVRAMKP